MEHSANQTRFQIYSGQELTVRFEEDLLLLFGLKGRSEIVSHRQTYVLEPAGMLAVNPFEVYQMHCPMDASVIGFRIPSTTLEHADWSGDCSCYIRSGENETPTEHRLKSLFAEIFQSCIEHNSSADTANPQKVAELLGMLKTHYRAVDIVQQPREATMRRLFRILERIEQRWNEDLSLSMIAEEEYLSVSYLSRFFQKNLHMSFSQYLKELRLSHAAQMLIKNTASVTRIAYDCGFHAPSVFIEAFKQQYGETPGQFRQQKQEELRRQSDPKTQNDTRSDVSVLLAYVPETSETERRMRTVSVSIDTEARQTLPHAPGRRILNIGYARDGLMAPIQKQILQAQADIGFEFIRFHGILDEDMHIYWEDRNGEPQFSFYYVDLLFDFIRTTDLKPIIELSFMPTQLAREQIKIYDRPSVISGCTDLEKWKQLVTALVRHLIRRYGIAAVRRCRFTTIGQSYVHLQCVNWEDYKALYCTTYRTIKEIDRTLLFGGPGCFAELIDRDEGIPAFLSFAEEQDCVPDFLSFQFYPHVHTYDSLFLDFTMSQQSSPAILSEDADYLKHTLEKLEHVLEQHALSDLEIFVEESTSTLWQRDFASDSCYKAVWLAKNLSDSCGRAVFGYWLLTDLLEERAKIESVFHGGYGLMTYNGIPKSGYHAMRLFSRMGDTVIASGEGWLLTTDGTAYQLLVYNYCHYSNLYRYRYQRLQQPEDAYSVFETGEDRRMQFALSGLAGGTYRIERQKIGREQGSAFDKWVELGAPDSLNAEETAYLIGQGSPSVRMEQQSIDARLHLESILHPQEMEYLRFYRLDDV